MSDIVEGPTRVEVRLTTDPSGNPGVLVQLPDGFIIIKKPQDVADLVMELAGCWGELLHALEASP